jgi:hypothetical protein
MTGDGSRDRETISHACYMTISRLCEVMPFLTSLTTEFMVRKLQLSAEMQIHDVLAASLHHVRSRALFRDTKSCTHMPELQSRMLSGHTQLEASIDFRIKIQSSFTNRYGTQPSRMRLAFGGATTFKERVITVPESRTLTANNNHTGVNNPYRELSTYRKCWNKAP